MYVNIIQNLVNELMLQYINDNINPIYIFLVFLFVVNIHYFNLKQNTKSLMFDSFFKIVEGLRAIYEWDRYATVSYV